VCLTVAARPFVLHGKVQKNRDPSIRMGLATIVQEALGNSLEVYGCSWRYMCKRDDWDSDVVQSNTVPHFDTFSGWQLCISITVAGTFQLGVCKNTCTVGVGQTEAPGAVQVCIMAVAHSHDQLMNPLTLKHYGQASSDLRRLLLRVSLKGSVDNDTFSACDFVALMQSIAGYGNLQYFDASPR